MTRAGSQPPALPHTWRPFGARLMGIVLGVLLVALVVATWIAFGPKIRASFSWQERATLGFLSLIAVSVWYSVIRCRVTARDDRLIVVNGYRRHELEWPQAIAVSMPRGAPWATLDLSDGTTISLLAIQGSDGRRAADAVVALRVLIEDRTQAPPD